MPEHTSDIDTSVLDKLIEIRKRQTLLQEFCTRAERLKGKVDEAVHRRVVDDYAKRDAALEQEAAPLKSQARQEYQKLRALYDRVNSAHDAARLTKEELEFRQAVGELDEDELAARLQEPAGILEHCDAELAALDEQKARFLEALPGDEVERATERPVVSVGVEPAEVGEGSLDATRLVSPEPERVTGPEPPPIQAGQAPGAAPSAPEEVERTLLLPEGMLMMGEEGGKPVEYPLGMFNYIGRSEENHIRIARAGISRRHAVVRAGPDGFTIRDLQSQNGTFVNGEQVTERRLADGDRIAIGDAQLVFRSRAAAPARPTAGSLSPPIPVSESAHGDPSKRAGRNRAS